MLSSGTETNDGHDSPDGVGPVQISTYQHQKCCSNHTIDSHIKQGSPRRPRPSDNPFHRFPEFSRTRLYPAKMSRYPARRPAAIIPRNSRITRWQTDDCRRYTRSVWLQRQYQRILTRTRSPVAIIPPANPHYAGVTLMGVMGMGRQWEEAREPIKIPRDIERNTLTRTGIVSICIIW